MTSSNVLPKLFGLTGRTALITGASRGLGLAIAAAFVQAGASVVMTGRDQKRLRAAAEYVRSLGGSVHVASCADLRTRSGIHKLLRSLASHSWSIDILFNNAAEYVGTPLEAFAEVDWDRVLQLNLTSCVLLTKAVVPQMKERGWGRVIFMSSILGYASRPGSLSYSATKAALLGVARAAAVELGPFGITVNCIAPGPFNVREPEVKPSKKQTEKFSRWAALGRWGKPIEVVGPALLLASDAGSYITGSVLIVDGGVLARTLAE